MLCDTGSNCFVLKDPNYLYDLIPSYDAMDITRGSNSVINFKGTLCVYLHCKETSIITQIKDVPCIKSNPHNGFILKLFKDFGFKQVINFARDKIILQNPDKKNIVYPLHHN